MRPEGQVRADAGVRRHDEQDEAAALRGEAASALEVIDGVARRAGMEVRARRLEADLLRSPHDAAPGKEAARGLQLGSADPHMVREPGEVCEPWRRGAGTFSINKLDPADWEELCVRAFPVMNPIPSTDARESQWSQTPGAPVIDSIEQVVPVETLKRIGRWRARLRACLKAAARGSYVLAKLLRPPDLVLVSEAHTTARAGGWVWDLRPLARGERAVPMAGRSVSGFSRRCVWVFSQIWVRLGFLVHLATSRFSHGEKVACRGGGSFSGFSAAWMASGFTR